MGLLETISNLWSPKKEGANWWYRFYSSKHDTFKTVDCLESYEKVSEVSAIINMKARAFSNMRLKEVDKDGNEKQTPAGQALINLIQNPNWFQAGHEFLIQTKTFREIFGNEYIFKTTPVGFKTTIDRTKALFAIPGNIVESKYDNSIPYFLNVVAPKITYKVKNESRWDEYDSELIIHFNDNRANIRSSVDKHLLNGTSKLELNSCVINNIKAAYESRGVILRQRGANGAWVTKSKDGIGAAMPMNPDEKEDLQKQLANYGTLAGQNQDIITNSDLAWVQRGPNDPQKLGIFQEIEEDFNKLLDAFGVPSEIFVRTKGATYENQRQAEKGLYVRTIMPEANEWIGGLSSEFLPEGSQTSIVAEYTHLPIFQEDLKSRGEALNSMINCLSRLLQDKQITQEEYRQELTKIGIGDGQPIPTQADANQQEVETQKAQAQLRGSVGGVQGILAIQTAVSQGTATREAALSTLTIIYGFTDQQASDILGNPQPTQAQTF